MLKINHKENPNGILPRILAHRKSENGKYILGFYAAYAFAPDVDQKLYRRRFLEPTGLFYKICLEKYVFERRTYIISNIRCIEIRELVLN